MAKRGRRFVRRLIAWMIVLGLAMTGYMMVSATFVDVERADVYLRDLPEAFDGTTILFISDIHVDAFNAPSRAAGLLAKLQPYWPDIVLLGGDYTSVDPATFLTGLFRGEKLADIQAARRDALFDAIADFYAPLGKLGVKGNHDAPVPGLAASLMRGGFMLLEGEGVRLEKDGASLYIAGIPDHTTGDRTPDALAAAFRPGDCVIAVAHNPNSFPSLIEAGTRGTVYDLVLSGHTHGGQVIIPGFFERPFAWVGGTRFRTGWYQEGDAHLLVSNGVGTTGLPIRLCAPPQAHVITLRKGG